ncbi:hypothetical protein ACEPAI_2903 [Sanghuangporus weigelae]
MPFDSVRSSFMQLETKLSGLAFRDALLLDIACALSVHAVYKHYEPDASLFVSHLLLLIAVPALPAICFLHHLDGSIAIAILCSFSLFYFTLAVSIVSYRLSPLHPLATYPGPLLAKITKFWGASMTTKGKYHVCLKNLHEKYGPYVRIGPNEISVLDVSVISSVLGADGMPKGPLWSGRVPKGETPSLIATRSFHEHARRRKRWNRAFNSMAVKGYEAIIQKRALQLVDELEKRSTKYEVSSVNLAEWLSYFSTDFMGDMAFGGGFELMRDGYDKDGIWMMIESGLRSVAFFQHIPWLVPLIHMLPFKNRVNRDILEFGRKRARARQTTGSLTKDLFYHLIDEDHVEPAPPGDDEIVSDGLLAITAGSDTTSTTLSGLFYHLLSNPLEYKHLQRELDAAFPPGGGDPFDSTKLSELPFLNAVINEAMRLQPAVPSCLQRSPAAGSGGKCIGDSFITEGTAVVIPLYALFRNPAYFSPAPDSFWPERWQHQSAVKRTPHSAASVPQAAAAEPESDSEVITNTAAFIPFSYGPAHCAGRALAITEMRMVVALLMQRFELRFAPDYEPHEWEESLEDFFIFCNGPLRVSLKPRM